MSEAAPTSRAPGASDLLAQAREALARRAWRDAYDLFARADAERPLSGADLELEAEAAFFAGEGDARIGIKERAYRAHLDDGDRVRAAYMALQATDEHLLRGRTSIASGWARRAEPLLEGEPESYAHGYLALVRSDLARRNGDLAGAEELAERAVDIAKRSGHPDLRASALTALGTIKIGSGSAPDGIELLEEAATAAVSGELSPITAGITSCQMIAACRDLTDYGRAREWLEATDRWCQTQSVSGFPGICRIHRAELVALQGGWDRAEEELRRATTELRAFAAVPPMADGIYALGDLRRLRGDHEGAEAALREAHALGRSPQPALALIRLAEGQVHAAMAAIEAAVRDTTWDQWARARLLAALTEIAIAAGDVTRARSAADELASIAAGYDSPALRASTSESLGRVLLAEKDASGAIVELRAAVRLWLEVGAAYEIARARSLLADALRRVGDDADADLELGAARDEFARLGARPDLERIERELRRTSERRGESQEVRRTFMFTDIVGSTKLAEALGDDSWVKLLRWHDETLRDRIARHGGTVVNSTGDGFFATFEAASSAAASAIEIQRSLAEHRRESGFAPPVRIGIHTADAVVRGTDYGGVGVHVASRLADTADGGQIIISAEALEEAGLSRATNRREVEVRGISAPVAVADLEWR